LVLLLLLVNLTLTAILFVTLLLVALLLITHLLITVDWRWLRLLLLLLLFDVALVSSLIALQLNVLFALSSIVFLVLLLLAHLALALDLRQAVAFLLRRILAVGVRWRRGTRSGVARLGALLLLQRTLLLLLTLDGGMVCSTLLTLLFVTFALQTCLFVLLLLLLIWLLLRLGLLRLSLLGLLLGRWLGRRLRATPLLLLLLLLFSLHVLQPLLPRFLCGALLFRIRQWLRLLWSGCFPTGIDGTDNRGGLLALSLRSLRLRLFLRVCEGR
jgi:hypothetical protein